MVSWSVECSCIGTTQQLGKGTDLGVCEVSFQSDFNFFVLFLFSFSGKRNKTLWPDCGWPFPWGWHSCHPVLPLASTVPITEVLCLFSPRWTAEVGVGSGGLVAERGCVTEMASDSGCDVLMTRKR